MAKPVLRVVSVSRWCVVGAVLFSALALATEWVRLPVPDVSWLLHVAGRVSEGAVYGVDVVDVAPPPIIWYSIPAVLLGEWTGLGPWRGFLLVLGVTGLAILTLVRRISRLTPGGDAATVRVLVMSAALAIYVLPWGIFGEREHVALVLVLPYVLLFAVREGTAPVPIWLAITAGVTAGLGFAIKPHYALPWAALALVALWRQGPTSLARRPEFLAAALTAVACIAVVLAAEPGYVEYMRRFGGLYLHYVPQNLLFVALFGESNSALVVVVAAVATTVLWGSLRATDRPTVGYLLVAALAFHLVAAMQMKGWRYHYLPGVSLSFLVLVVIWVSARPPFHRLATRAYHAAALGTVVVLLGKAALGNGGRLRGSESATFDPNFEGLLAVVEQHGDGKPLAVLSANLASAFPLAAEASTGWALRYGGLPWLPAFYPEAVRAGEVARPRPFAERGELERWFGESVVADLYRSTPGLIVFPTPRPGSTYTRLFDYPGYFEDVPGFRALIGSYVPIGRVGSYTVLLHRQVARKPAVPFPEADRALPARRILSDGGERAVLGLLVAGALLLAGVLERRQRSLAEGGPPGRPGVGAAAP